ncbi:uncharacterized protein LOC132203839 [Neocloeon triangulifer]|uniref:uncharacterized protein LOC132203839 n=1 Tax=Neocloeon triangulifer TaxID=2078957 RepID=UPI00286F22E2|nr:uncharacterized protein LOC132203839 [Neocloeon triangulifer]
MAKRQLAGFGPSRAASLKRGQKRSNPDGSWLEEEEINRSRLQQRALLTLQRKEKKCLRSTAEWVPEKALARVTKKQGKLWSTFGFERDKHVWLRPEEALYLLDANLLELRFGGVALSVQQAHTLLLGQNLSGTDYKVYSKLRSEGWIVLPHQKPTPTQKTAEPPPLTSAKPPTVEVIDLDEEDRFKAFDVYVPRAQGRSQVFVQAAPAHLLPPGARPSRKNYLLNLQNIQPPRPIFNCPPRPQQPNNFCATGFFFYFQGGHSAGPQFRTSVQSFQCRQSFQRPTFHRPTWRGRKEPEEYHNPPTPCRRKEDTSKNWAQLKTFETINLEPEEERPKFTEHSVLLPEDCKNYQQVLAALQIFPDAATSCGGHNLQRLVIKYNVFPPSTNFRKSAPPPPECHLVILGHREEVPTEGEMTQLAEETATVPLVFAVVHSDSIQFVSLDEVDMTLV